MRQSGTHREVWPPVREPLYCHSPGDIQRVTIDGIDLRKSFNEICSVAFVTTKSSPNRVGVNCYSQVACSSLRWLNKMTGCRSWLWTRGCAGRDRCRNSTTVRDDEETRHSKLKSTAITSRSVISSLPLKPDHHPGDLECRAREFALLYRASHGGNKALLGAPGLASPSQYGQQWWHEAERFAPPQRQSSSCEP